MKSKTEREICAATHHLYEQLGLPVPCDRCVWRQGGRYGLAASGFAALSYVLVLAFYFFLRRRHDK